MKRLSETLKRGNNNFDLVRLIAALAVLFGHSFGVQPHSGRMESVLVFTHRESSGSLAVYAFFLISGMLVSASFARQASIGRFLALRALRIWPAVIVCSIFIALVVGPLFTQLPVATYLTAPATLGWLARNTILLAGVGGMLPGLFDHNHLAGLVNATFWTLPVELECYVIVLVAGLLGAIGSRKGTLMAVTFVAVAFAVLLNYLPVGFTLGGFFLKAPAYSFYPVPFFLLGMLLYPFRQHVPLDGRIAALLLIVYVVTRFSLFSAVLLYPVFAYAVLCFASSPWLYRFTPKHDYSYGIYLYGFVVQQCVANVYPLMDNYLSLLISVPVTVVLAMLSWHLIERRCLESVRRKTQPDAIPASPTAEISRI